MSAGGPIIAPKSNVFVITPICPHMLTVRPIVISDDKIVRISVDSPDGKFPLNLDGDLRKMLAPGQSVTVRKSPQAINLVANEKRSYCEILRKKLLWGHEHPAGQ
jgi:NAD+ kinase